MFFRNYQNMCWSNGIYVIKSQNVVILIDYLSWNLAVPYLAKKTIFHEREIATYL